MGFTFLHTADWQIGKPFRSFDERTSGRLEEARLDAIDRIGKTAQETRASHVLVAGDVFDCDGLPRVTLRQPLERMARHTNVRWVLLPGNHDPDQAGGIWQRIAGIGLPDNVVVCSEPEPMELAPGVVLLPAPLKTKSVSHDPTQWMSTAATPPGALRIGLAHGSVQGFGSAGDGEGLIDPGRVQSANLHYLALGDWHGMTKIGSQTWYSGTPEPDRFLDNAPGHALCVNLGDDGRADVQPVKTGRYTWAQHEATLNEPGDLDTLQHWIENRASLPSRLLLRLTLKGVLSLPQHGAVAAWIELMQARLQYLEVDQTNLVLSSDAADLAAFGDQGVLRDAAEVLRGRASSGSSEDAAVAADALKRLFVLVREAREAGA